MRDGPSASCCHSAAHSASASSIVVDQPAAKRMTVCVSSYVSQKPNSARPVSRSIAAFSITQNT